MRLTQLCGVILVSLAVTACGGGGKKGAAQPSPTSPSTPPATPPATPPSTPPQSAPAAEVQLTLTTPAIRLKAVSGDDVDAVLDGQWSATNLGSGLVYLQVSDDHGMFATPAVQPAPAGGAYSFALTSAASRRSVGTHTGILTVRACADAQCLTPYTNASKSVEYSITVIPTPEWETLQGNAAHDGYVPITLDPSKFVKAWQWTRPTPGVIGGINSVATSEGLVFVSEDEYAGSPSLYALDTATGEIRWKQQFTNNWSPALNPPATSNGNVYVTTTGHGGTFLWSFKAKDGTPLAQSSFSTQWANLLAPTVKNGRVYVNAGSYGGVMYAFDATSGTKQWEGVGGTYGMNTPAVDDKYLYIHDGDALAVLDAGSGESVARIGFASTGSSLYDYHGAPMIASADSVIAWKGGAFSGRAASSAEPSANRQLVDYGISQKTTRWSSIKSYKTQPAIAKGVVYAASDNPKSLDAIDEATGVVLWSWVPGTSDTKFHRNIVVTNNLLFVSTDRALYAIDLATHRPVWQSATPGMVAISGQRMLFVTTGTTLSDGKLVAFRTR